MAANATPRASQIAIPAATQSNEAVLIAKYAGRVPFAPLQQAWAPA